MRHDHFLKGIGTLTAGVLLTAPAAAQLDGPLGSAAGHDEVLVRAALIQGEGAGTIGIPTVTSQGQLVGVLADGGSFDRYIVQATLTSFLPNTGEGAAMGGLYGKVFEIDANGVVLEQKALYLDGTWELDGPTSGTISASMLTTPRLGSAELIGRLEGKFAVPTEGRMGALAFDAAAPEGKRARPIQSVRDVRGRKPAESLQSARDVRGEEKHRDDPFRSAREANGKRKLRADAYDDARSSEDGILFTAPIAMQFVLVQ